MSSRRHWLFLLAGLLASCEDFKCIEIAAEYDFAVGMLPQPDTLNVGSPYRVDYFGSFVPDIRNQENATELHPLFGVTIKVYLVDTTGDFPLLTPAADFFDVTDLIPGSFAGKNHVNINMNILRSEDVFLGGIYIRPRQPGWYLLRLQESEAYQSDGGGTRKCRQLQRIHYRLIDPVDPHGAYYNSLQRASVFDPATERLLWVK